MHALQIAAVIVAAGAEREVVAGVEPIIGEAQRGFVVTLAAPVTVPDLDHTRRPRHHVVVAPSAAGAVWVAEAQRVRDDEQPAARLDLRGNLRHGALAGAHAPVDPLAQAQRQCVSPERGQLHAAHRQEIRAAGRIHLRET